MFQRLLLFLIITLTTTSAAALPCGTWPVGPTTAGFALKLTTTGGETNATPTAAIRAVMNPAFLASTQYASADAVAQPRAATRWTTGTAMGVDLINTTCTNRGRPLSLSSGSTFIVGSSMLLPAVPSGTPLNYCRYSSSTSGVMTPGYPIALSFTNPAPLVGQTFDGVTTSDYSVAADGVGMPVGRTVMIGYRSIPDTCTGICPPIPPVQYRAAADRYVGGAAPDNFSSNFLTYRPLFAPGQAPYSERPQTITPLPRVGGVLQGYLAAGEAEFYNVNPLYPQGKAVLFMQLGADGGLNSAHGGVYTAPIINGLLTALGDTGIITDLRVKRVIQRVGGTLLVGDVADSGAGTPYARAPRAFLLALTTTGVPDAAFAGGGLALLPTDYLGTARYEVTDVVVTASTISVLFIDPPGISTGGIQTARFSLAGVPDATWGLAGVRQVAITGCVGPTTTTAHLAVDTAGTLQIVGAGHR